MLDDGKVLMLVKLHLGNVNCEEGSMPQSCIKTRINGKPLLHCATLDCDIERVQLLLAMKVDINEKDQYGMTALHFAAEKGSIEILEMLLRRGAKVNSLDERRRSPLYWAIINGQYFASEILIKNGADVNSKAVYGVRPLHLAVRKNNYALVDLILDDYKVKVDAQTNDGYSAMYLAINSGAYKIVKLLIKKGKAELNACFLSVKNRFLHFAISKNSYPMAEALIRFGINVNTQDEYGRTPLHLCYNWKKDQKILKLLLKVGADVYIEDKWGFSVVDYAIKATDVVALKKFLKKRDHNIAFLGKIRIFILRNMAILTKFIRLIGSKIQECFYILCKIKNLEKRKNTTFFARNEDVEGINALLRREEQKIYEFDQQIPCKSINEIQVDPWSDLTEIKKL